MKTAFHGYGFHVIQNNIDFYATAIPASIAAKSLGFMTLEWDEDTLNFRGFNREIKDSHVNKILQYLKSDDCVLPNVIIVYFINEHFEFKAINSLGKKPTVGEVKIKIPIGPDGDKAQVGFVIDGQHRLKALELLPKESAEEELEIPFVILIFTSPTVASYLGY